MEELGEPYKLVVHERDPATMRAPADLSSKSPFGKAPAIEDGDLVVAESGAIIAHVLARRGAGRLEPAAGSDAWSRHTELLHLAEATAMPALMIELVEYMGAQVPGAVRWMVGPTGRTVLDRLALQLGDSPYMLGDTLTAADIQLWFVIRVASFRPDFADYPTLKAYLDRLEARPAFLAAIARGGPVAMGGGRAES